MAPKTEYKRKTKNSIKSRLKVIPELRDFLPPQDTEERRLLENSIATTKVVKEPLEYMVLDGEPVVVDGHNRFELIRKYKIPETNWSAVEIPAKTIEEAQDYMIVKQFSRRNASKEMRDHYLGLLYNRQKSRRGGTAKKENVAEKLAKEHNVSVATIKRVGKKAEQIEKIKEKDPELGSKLQTGEVKPTPERLKSLLEPDGEVKKEPKKSVKEPDKFEVEFQSLLKELKKLKTGKLKKTEARKIFGSFLQKI